jgi:hypothetical protein
MGINAKSGVKIIKGEAFIHPLDLEDIEFLIKMIANSNHRGSDIGKVMEVTEKLRKEYDRLVEHFTEESS